MQTLDILIFRSENVKIYIYIYVYIKNVSMNPVNLIWISGYETGWIDVFLICFMRRYKKYLYLPDFQHKLNGNKQLNIFRFCIGLY